MKEDVRTHWQALFGRRLLCLEAVPHQAVADYLKRLDVFVLPSYSTPLWKEQFGLTLAQAMMAGAACVGSSSGAIPEVIGTAGLVVPERNVDSLAQALEILLLSESIRESLRAKARTVALQRFTNASVAARYLAEFQAVAPQTSAAQSRRARDITGVSSLQG